jgi:sulfhydrogenase subunit gamma (sulfur reductase)
VTIAAAQLATARVLDACDETPTLRTIRLALPAEAARAHQRPGQVVKLHVPVGDAYFAVASAPSPDGTIELLVKRGGRVSDAAIAAARPGASLAISAPFGKGFPVEQARGHSVLLFAAGSGIAPVRALVQHILAHRDEFDRVTLFYGQRHGADFAYRREHLAWERGGVRVVLCPSQADEAWPGVRGRVQEVASALAFGGAPPESSVAFVCGMTAMVDDLRATLSRAGMAQDRVHLNF